MGRVFMSGFAPLLTKPTNSVLASSLAIGSSVYLNENGSLAEYLVVHQGNPNSSLYDSSCDGTWLLRKDIYTTNWWHSSQVNDYANSFVHSYLNNDFLAVFDTATKNSINRVKLPYRAGSGYGTTVTSGANGLTASVFLLSADEVGCGEHSYAPEDGAKLDYFNLSGTNGDPKRISYYNGTATMWWLRSPMCWSAQAATQSWVVYTTGECWGAMCTSTNGIRPALIISGDTEFNKKTMTIKDKPIAEKLLSSLSEGDIVTLNESGSPVEFYIAKHNYEPDLNGEGRTLLVRKSIYRAGDWHTQKSTQTADYLNSKVDEYLNNTYKSLLDADIQTAISTTKFHARYGDYGATATIGDKSVFILSLQELGGPSQGTDQYPEGNTLPTAELLRNAFTQYGSGYIWTRSGRGDNVFVIQMSTGNSSISGYWTSCSYVPCFTLPADSICVNSDNSLYVKANTPSYASTFSDNTWSDIITACQTNKVPDTWTVGSQKTMTINGTDYVIDIIGKNHDTYSDGSGTAPLTFQLHDCYGTMYAMDNRDTNGEGWLNCPMRITHLPSILLLMPNEIQAGIKEVNKLTSAGSQSSVINTAADKLFLLSEIEVFGSTTYSFAGEGSQYTYYQAENSKIKKVNGSNYEWWIRSPYKSHTQIYCEVYEGTPGINRSYQSIGVAFAFCF